ncbi:hypothetical protein JCM15831A_17120 [Asaia astilbis]
MRHKPAEEKRRPQKAKPFGDQQKKRDAYSETKEADVVRQDQSPRPYQTGQGKRQFSWEGHALKVRRMKAFCNRTEIRDIVAYLIEE